MEGGAQQRANDSTHRDGAVADLRLSAAVRDKDRKATAEFVERFVDAVHSYVSHRLFPNALQAEDLVQEVFLAALQHIGSFTGKASLSDWLLGIARHKVDDHYRRVLREANFDDVAALDLASDDDPALTVDNDCLRARTIETLGRLREDYRILLRWRYWEYRSTAEISALTGRTEKSIERATARARAQFKRLWEEADA
jgi:RNA polymerase sigma-70 factor (ECF subfamily)